MNIYRLLNIYTRIRSHRLRALGILAMHLLHKRYTCMFLDPVIACNLRCQMCYFSDAEKRKSLHGIFSREELQLIARQVFPHLRKLQIGCGAEPTIYKHLDELVRLGKQYGVPYIALTTNGNLLTLDKLCSLAASGLDEITLSLHGTSRDNYERLMEGANFDTFVRLLKDLENVKLQYPGFAVRINYTVNEDNVEDLRQLPQLLGDLHIDTLQLRPIQKIGDTKYHNFSMLRVLKRYDDCIMPLVRHCQSVGTRCIYPTRDNISQLQSGDDNNQTRTTNNISDMAPYFYLSPWQRWKEDFNPYEEDFYGYCRRRHRIGLLLRGIFLPSRQSGDYVTKSMNYEMK